MMSSRLRHISKSRENEEREREKKLFSFQLQEGISPLKLNQSLYPTLQELSSIHFMTVMTHSKFMITPHCVTKHVSLLQIRYIKKCLDHILTWRLTCQSKLCLHSSCICSQFVLISQQKNCRKRSSHSL